MSRLGLKPDMCAFRLFAYKPLPGEHETIVIVKRYTFSPTVIVSWSRTTGYRSQTTYAPSHSEGRITLLAIICETDFRCEIIETFRYTNRNFVCPCSCRWHSWCDWNFTYGFGFVDGMWRYGFRHGAFLGLPDTGSLVFRFKLLVCGGIHVVQCYGILCRTAGQCCC